MRELQQMLAPFERGGVGRDAGGGAAQHQDGPGPFCQPAGYRRRVVGRDTVLLERGRFFFVDRDQPKTRERRENSGARPDHDVRLAAPDPPPLGGPPASVSALCRTASRPGKRAAKRPTVCGVSAISGTSTRPWPPPASTCSSRAR